jgi:hypothetical protein
MEVRENACRPVDNGSGRDLRELVYKAVAARSHRPYAIAQERM